MRANETVEATSDIKIGGITISAGTRGIVKTPGPQHTVVLWNSSAGQQTVPTNQIRVMVATAATWRR